MSGALRRSLSVRRPNVSSPQSRLSPQRPLDRCEQGQEQRHDPRALDKCEQGQEQRHELMNVRDWQGN